MQQGKHIGKIVVDYSDRPAQVKPAEINPVEFRQDGTYWIAGGLGGFGLQIASWMVRNGAGHLVLSGRSARPSPEEAATIQQLTQQGANIVVMPCDISDADDVRATLRQIDEALPPLRGVFHAAMVLEDRLLVDLDRDTLQRVLRPKVLGGLESAS